MSAPGMVRRAAESRADWETPSGVFEALDREFRFTLDAAASEANAKCDQWREGPCEGAHCVTCGLHSNWANHRVFLNPPYGAGLPLWVQKCGDAANAGATVVALLPDAIDTEWFRTLFARAHEVRIVVGRIQFVGTTSSNPSGSIVAVYRPGGRHYPAPVVSLWDWRPS